MPETVTHPTAQALAAFALGQLPDSAATVVAQHLETCSTCLESVTGQPADSFMGKVQAAKPGHSVPPGPSSRTRVAGAPIKLESPAASSAPVDNLPPELVNHTKYRIERELGRGGMGVVYQAMQTRMDRSVALKVINPSVLEHPDALPRFEAEVKAVAKLDHPNIARAFDADQAGNLHLLVMEFVDGMNLADVVKKKGPLPIANGCHYIRQAALGLQHAFEKGMVHRDIKPHNLMLTPRGQVKILDFGLARLRDEGPKKSGRLTTLGAFMGTPEYVSPEQATDARNADTRADIYSLGCTLYFLLTGRPPFQEETIVQLVLAQIEKEPQPLHEVRPDVPPELSAVVGRMLAKDPNQRYQKPVEVAQALLPFVKAAAKGAGKDIAPLAVKSPGTATVLGGGMNKPSAPRPGAATQLPAAKARAAEGAADPFASLDEPIPSKETAKTKASKGVRGEWYKRKPVLGALGVAVLAVVLLAGVVFKIKTAGGDAFIVLEVDQPDTEVLVDGQKITVNVPGDNEPVEIKAVPGRHQLQISKGGFEVVTRDIELKTGKSAPIRVRLDPVQVAAGTPGEQPVDSVNPKPKENSVVPAQVAADKSAEEPVKPTGPEPGTDGFVPLFNGKDLTGWSVAPIETGNYEGWVVEEGALVAHGDDYKTRNFLFSDREYADFVLRLEFSFDKNDFVKFPNSGVGLRAIPGEKLPAYGRLIQDYPVLKLGDPREQTQPTGTTSWVLDGFGVKPDRSADLQPPGSWNRLEIEVKGRTIRTAVNATQILDAALAPGALLSDGSVPALGRPKGRIGLQKHTGTVRFRNIEIKELPLADAAAPPAPATDAFVPLFNGKDLTGWKTHPSQPGNWRVENGILTGSSDGVSHLYTDRGDYTDFHLRLEARVNLGDGSDRSGVYFRAPFGPNLPADKPTWVSGYNAKIDARRLGGLLIDLKGELHRTRETVLRPGEWITYEIIAEGNQFVIKVNGETTSDYMDWQRLYTNGHIVLQQHGAATVVEFRKIEIKELTPERPGTPATTAMTPDPATSEPDPIKEKLDQARADYQAEADRLRKDVLDSLDKAEDAARQAGNKKAVDQIKDEQTAFIKEEKLPRGVATKDYQQQKAKARAAFVAAYQTAVADYTKAKMDSRADAVDSERKRFELDVPLDALQPGSVWKGMAEQVINGKAIPPMPFTLTVLSRDDKSFSARDECGKIIWEIHGTVDQGVVRCLAKDVKVIEGGEAGFDHAGTLSGDRLELRTSGVANGKTIIAVMKLQLQKQ